MMSRYLTFVFGLMLLLSVGSCPVLAQEASPYSYENQLDINNAEYEDIARLPLPADLAEKIYDRILYQGPFTSIFQLREIEGIDQPLLLKLKPLIRIEPYMERSEREERLEELYYQLDRWGGDEGSNQALIDSWIEQALSPVNINEMRLDELLNLQGVSPVDAAAIINYRNESGRIASLRDLRNAPYLSYFGYRNTRNFVSFEEAAPTREFHGTLLTRMSNTPFLTEEGDVTSASIGDLADVGANDYPDVYTRLIGSWGPDLKFGVSHWRSLGEPSLTSDIGFAKVPDLKVYLGLENRKLGPVDLRKLYLGNYTIAFGQGVVMENTDFFTPRKSGFGFRKRYLGLAGDNSRTREFKFTGAAAELGYKNAHLFLFGAFDKRDAILNRTPILFDGEEIHPFNQLIVLDQRFEYAPLDSSRRNAGLPWRSSVKELMYGFHGAYDLFPATQIGLTYYESAYNRPLRPEILEIVNGSDAGQIGLTDNEIYNAYGGPVSDGSNPFWSDAKSFRRVYGLNLQSIYENVALQAEYAELDTDGGLALFRKEKNPWAFVGSAYVQYNSFNLMALYRNYQVGFDNPYQRSFSNYNRFKRTIYEDYFYLQDDFYLQLYTNNPQPQAERGWYFNSRYQINRKLVLTMEYDNWLRNADDVSQYRLRGNLQFRPIFPITIDLRQKYQGREALNSYTLEYFENSEFRARVRFRLSRFNELALLYGDSRVDFRPRPRLSFPVDPTDPGDVYGNDNLAGTKSLPGSVLGGSYTHNFNEWLKVRGFLGYYQGFFWNFEDTQFFAVESDRGAMRYWLSVYSRISPSLSIRFKYTHDYQYPINYVQTRDSGNQVVEPGNSLYVPGQSYGGSLKQPSQQFYYIEMNYHF